MNSDHLQPDIVSASSADEKTWAQTYLYPYDQTTQRSRGGLLKWWYRYTAPPEPSPDAHINIREIARRGKLSSSLGLGGIIALLINTIGSYLTSNHIVMIVVPPLILLMYITLFTFNRRGKVNIGGAIISSLLSLAFFTIILSSPHGLDAQTLLLLDLLVTVELVVGSTLPVNWIVLPWLANSAFIVLVIFFMPRTPILAATLKTQFALIIARPLALHLIVTLVVWLWIQSATEAIKRANNAEMIAKLEHTIALQKHHEVEEKQKIDRVIEQLIKVHTQVGNGNFSARVPLEQGMPLWVLAGSLNNLLSRLQQLRETDAHLKMQLELQREQFYQAISHLQQLELIISAQNQVLINAQRQQRPVHLSASDTVLDTFAKTLNGKYIVETLPK